MKVEPNVVISEFIVNMKDPFKNADNNNVNISKAVANQAKSLAEHYVPFYVLTNANSQEGLAGAHIVHHDLFNHFPNLSLYFHRILMAYEFLQSHPEIKKAALTDATDVVMLNYPFDSVKDGILYMGDEPFYIFATQTINITSITGRPEIKEINNFIKENALLQTLNLGVMVGTRAVLLEYLGIMVKIITDTQLAVAQGQPEYQLSEIEMALSNYVAYQYFSDRLIHGREVTTVFEGMQKTSSAWFSHK
ncbi:hypothetical protein [Pediococcus acidilactici]|uniref:hypothetical protein n=1 Tax=Pediococcus acidilactici TaxID=1254 RepID=UPI003CF099C2